MAVSRSVVGLFLLFGVLIAASGCDSSSSGGGGASMDELAGAMSAQRAADEKAAKEEAERQAQAAQQAAQAPAEPQRTRAGRPGVEPGGYYTAIVGARRHILNEVDTFAWKQAVQHFRATEGRKPKDHEEFMKRIVIPLEIDLGYKEENHEFLYDPTAESDGDLGVLYVVEKEPAE